MNTRKILLTLGGLLAGATLAQAQFDLQLPLQYGPQQLISNPALLQDHKISIALPSIGAGFLTPISVADAGEVRDGTLVIDPDQLINRLKERGNDQRFVLNVETIAFNYRHRGWQVGVSHAVRANGSMDIPKGLVQLAAYGNARFVGEELQVAPSFNAFAYQELGLNGAYTFYDRITVGGRVKYLNGTAALVSKTSDARLYTDPDYYEATITTDITLNSAGVPVSFTDEGIEVGDVEKMMGAGTGFAMDLGLVMQANDKLQIGLSVRDIGSIKWKGDAMQHRSNGTYTFSGYEGNVFENGDDFKFDAQGTLDSVIAAVQFESRNASFRSSLPTTLQSTVRYSLSKSTTFNGTLYAANAGVWHSGFGVGLGQRFGKFGHVGALAGLKRGGAYVGGNLLVDLWGPQFYVACDNLLTVFDLNNANDAYIRAGLNLTFGQIKRSKTVKGFYDTEVEGINR